MRIYEVKYTSNDYNGTEYTTKVVAKSAEIAAKFIGKRNGKFVKYSGYVTSVSFEVTSIVHIAK